MGNINDAIGVGITEEHAKAVVGTIEVGVTATGSSQSDAYALKAGATQVSTAAASTGVIIPAALPVHSEIRVYNAGANNLSVYPPSGCTINDEAANVAVIVPAGEGASFARLSNTVFGCNGCSDLTATELEYLDGVTAGTVTASKAVVVDSNKDIASFRNVTVTNLDAGASGTAGSVDVFPTTASKGKFILACTDQTGDTAVTLNANAMGQATTVNIPDPGAAASYLVQSTAALTLAEVDVLDAVTAGTVAASKAVVVDSNKDAGDFRNLDCVNLDAGASGTAGSVDVFPTTASKGKFILACTDQTGDTAVTLNANAMGQATTVNIPDPGAAASYLVQSTAALTLAEVDVLDAVTAGTVAASKAVVVDSNKDIASFRNVTVTNLDAGASGTAGSVDVFPSTASKGKFTLACTDQTGDTAVTLNANAMGQATTVNIADPGGAASYLVQSTAAITLAEADVLDGATAGTQVASKAVIADSNVNTGVSKVTELHIGASGSEVQVNATPAEINRNCDVSARITTLAATTLAVTEATHEGGIIVLSHTGAASTCTLPAASGSGGVYRFIVGAVNTSNHVIEVANASDTIDGVVTIMDVDDSSMLGYSATGTDDTITLNGTTTGGQIGDWVELVDIAANQWAIKGQLVCPAGSNPADPFSAAVS